MNYNVRQCFLVPPGVFVVGSLPNPPPLYYVCSYTCAHRDSYVACPLDFEVNEDALYFRYITTKPLFPFLSVG